MPAPEMAWRFYRFELLKHFQEDPEGWKHPWRWSTIVATMYVGAGEILTSEIAQMKAADVPYPGWDDEDVTNLLHQRYHLWQWEKAHPLHDIRSLESIVEFGSGYGAMALVCHRLGFRGTYYLVDFPEFSDLAMRNLRYRARDLDVKVGGIERPDMLISIFGLSEAPLETRNEFLGRTAPRSYLIGYQGRWGEIENEPWLLSWAQGFADLRGPDWKVQRERHAIYLVSTWTKR